MRVSLAAGLVVAGLAGCSGPSPGADGGTGGGAGGGTGGGGTGGSGAVQFKTFAVGDQALYELAIDSAGNVWAASAISAGSGNASVHRLTPGTGAVSSFSVAGGTTASLVAGPMAIDSAGTLWLTTAPTVSSGVLDPAVALVQVNGDGTVARRVANTGPANPNPCPTQPCAQNPFNQPKGVTLDASGTLWIPDTYAGNAPASLSRFSPLGGLLGTTAIPGASGPAVDAVAIDAQGNAWALDSNDKTLHEVSGAGVVLGSFTLPSAVQFAVNRLAFDKTGNLWVGANGTTQALIVVSPSGAVLRTITPPDNGTVDGLVVDSAGGIWVADTMNGRLLKLDASGTVVAQHAGLPSGGVSPSSGHAMAIDAAGNIWMASSGARGQLIEAVGVATGPTFFPYSGPQFP